MYDQPASDSQLMQGDMLDGCPLYSLEASPGAVDLNEIPSRSEERVIVLTQSCDLLQRKTEKIVVAPVYAAIDLVQEGVLTPAQIRDRISRGLVYGWYFLPAANPPMDLPESIIDLRDLHTVSRFVLEKLIADGRRVCRLTTPYREHLAQHFAVTYMRIGLPAPYETKT